LLKAVGVIEKVANITMLDYRDLDFARNWGLLVQDLGYYTRGLYRPHATLQRIEKLSPELLNEPNYQAAIEALKQSLKRGWCHAETLKFCYT